MSAIRSILVPGSLASETADDRIATYKIGLAGRAAAVFGVDEVIVYEDRDHAESRTVARVLAYQATAPYLRKRLFPISDELAHVGVLPPLNLPLHLVEARTQPGDVRMGALVGSEVDIGLPRLAELREGPEDAPEPEVGRQFPVEVLQVRQGQAVVRPFVAPADAYLGFVVERAPSLRVALKGQSPIIGTSRLGEPFAKKHLAPEGLAVVFGSPERGVTDLLGEKPRFPLVNTFPSQATRSVRLEEAILGSLAVINGIAEGLPADG